MFQHMYDVDKATSSVSHLHILYHAKHWTGVSYKMIISIQNILVLALYPITSDLGAINYDLWNTSHYLLLPTYGSLYQEVLKIDCFHNIIFILLLNKTTQSL